MATIAESAVTKPARIAESAVTKPARKRQRRSAECQREQVRRNRERRAVRAEADRIAAVEAEQRRAEDRERRAEAIAPAFLRNPVVVPKGRMIVGPRIQINGSRAVRGVEFPFASRRARRAISMLRQDWADVGAGLTAGTANYVGITGGGSDAPISGKDSAMLAQIEMRARLDGAMTYVGAFAPCLARIVLDCIPVATWAIEQAIPITPDAAMKHVLAAFNRLADWYCPMKLVEIGTRTFVIAPPREAYSVPGQDYAGPEYDERGRQIGA